MDGEPAVMDGAAPERFGPEWRLLELLCRGAGQGPRREALAAVLDAGVNWGELLDQAMRHRMLTLLAHALISEGLAGSAPLRVEEHLRSVLALNLYRRRIWYAEAGRVVDALERHGIVTAVRKGAAFESDLYGGNGSRWLGDIDLLVDLADRDSAARVMADLGYETGLYDFDTGEVTPFSRPELMRYRLNPDHSPTQSKVTGDPLVPVIEVDFAHSLTWARGDHRVPTRDLLDSVRHTPVAGLPGIRLPRLAPAHESLDTVLHLFREAWFEWWLDKEQDVDLMKFGDVLRLWHANERELACEEFTDRLREWRVVEPVCWVFEHMDRTFGSSAVPALGLTGRVDEAFLASAGGRGGSGREWDGDMRARLYLKDRRGLFERAGRAV